MVDFSNSSLNLSPEVTKTIVPLCRGKFITFDHLNYALSNYRGAPKIRANKAARERATPIIAENEVARLNEDAAAFVASDSAKKKRGSRLGDGVGYEQEYSLQETHTQKRLRSSQHDSDELELLHPSGGFGGNGQVQGRSSQNLFLQETCDRQAHQIKVLQNRCEMGPKIETSSLQRETF